MLPGKNIFWLKKIPDEEMRIERNLVRVILEPKLTLDKFHELLNAKLNFAIDRMKILKVVDTENAKKIIGKIVEYFTKVEEFLADSITDEVLDPRDFSNRVKLLKLNAIRNKKLSQFLSTIANDDKVGKLNAEQKAAYLRSVDGSSKAGRGLAMRAAKKNFNDKSIKFKERTSGAKEEEKLWL